MSTDFLRKSFAISILEVNLLAWYRGVFTFGRLGNCPKKKRKNHWEKLLVEDDATLPVWFIREISHRS